MDHLPRFRPRTMTVGELAAAVPGAELRGGSSVTVHGLEYNSRWMQPGKLFAALPGADFDGHDFITMAIASGACALLVERPQSSDVPQIVVPDSRAALAHLSAAFHQHPSQEMQVIGLTGTDGKTTTSHMLDHLLTEGGFSTGLVGTVGIKVGQGVTYDLGHQTTPESNLLQGYLREMTERGVTHPIVEATSHGLAMHRLDLVRFQFAGVTNMTHEHLEYHKTVENYWRAKGILVERVAAEGGVVVLNADDPGAMSAHSLAAGARVVLVSGQGKPVDLWASDHDVRADGTAFTLHSAGVHRQVTMPLIGGFNIDNALIAIGLAHSAGMELDSIVEALAVAGGVPGRMQLVEEGQDFSVVVDFAHTPESLRKILAFLRTIQQGRIIVVTGSAGQRDATKRPLQGAVCAELADISIFTNEDPRNEDPQTILQQIADGARGKGAIKGEDFHLIADRTEAIAAAFDLAQAGDQVVLAGKGHEDSIVIRDVKVPWNEEAVARRLLRKQYTSNLRQP